MKPSAPRRLGTAAVAVTLAASVAACTDRSPTAPVAPRPHLDVAASTLTTNAMISAGGTHNCASKLDGSVVCWGHNQSGQVSATPTVVAPFTAIFTHLGPFSRVSAGSFHTCAVRLDGTVACWGAGTTATAASSSLELGQSMPPAGLASATQVGTGFSHSCALTAADGAVTCWGENGEAQVSGTVTRPSPYVVTVATRAGPFTQLSTGDFHNCALRADDGAATCWGWDVQGQVDGTPRSGNIGVTFTHPGPFTQVDAGGTHSCAVNDDATVSCWGGGTTNTGTFPNYGQSIVPLDLGGVAEVSAGKVHTCARKLDGTVACWGAGSINTGTNPHYGQSIVPADLVEVARVSAGDYHTCAVKLDGSVRCWGLNNGAQVAIPFGLNLLFPQPITFTSTPPSPAFVGASYAVSATGGASGNPVMFASLTPTVCTVAGNQVSLVAAGNCILMAQQAGNDTYAPGRARQNFLVSRQPQVVTFTSAPPSPAYVGDSYVVAATGGGSGNPITFGSPTPAVCTLSGATVSFVGVGTCRVAANQAGNAAYLPAAQVTQDIVVSRRPQTITFASTPPSPALRGGSYAVSVIGGGSGNPVVLTSLTPAVCPLSGATLSFIAVGTCTVAADQAGNALYDAAPQATQSFAVVFNFGAGTGGGFADPVSSTTFNSARAGQSVPVSFDLGGDQGLLILAAQYPKSVAIACPSGGDPVNVVPETTTTAGQSGLTYDAATGLYTYVWKTDKAWAGSCREFVLKLADDTEHRARFQFAR